METIHPGQTLEITFSQANIDKITGISLVSVGDMNVKLDGAYVVDEIVSKSSGEVVSVKGTYSFSEPIEVLNVPNRMNPAGSMKPLYLTFTTGEAAETAGGGTAGPVRMILGYYDRFGDMRTLSVNDLRQYLIDVDDSFDSGSSRTALLLVDDLVQVRWIQVEPWHESGTDAASWTIAQVTAETSDMKADRTVNVTVWEGAPVQIIMASVSLSLSASTTNDEDETTTVETVDGEARILTRPGGSVIITPQVIGSNYGWSATAERVVSGFPASAASTITKRSGQLIFIAPENISGTTAEYWVTFTLEEAPSVKAVIKIGVESDSVDPTPVDEQPGPGDGDDTEP